MTASFSMHFDNYDVIKWPSKGYLGTTVSNWRLNTLDTFIGTHGILLQVDSYGLSEYRHIHVDGGHTT